ncbi:MAG: hypothetical protein KDK70_11210 [Myxococcales bacterium]|nr:hypothetical protein [Myxococcales bacterium]
MPIPWRIAPWLACLLPLGCFADPGTTPCPEGSEGCACVELQCEAGLVCSGGVCMAASTGTDTGPDPTTTTTAPGSTGGSTDDGADGSSSTTSPPADGTDTSTGEDLCGNGILDPGEMCDGTNACADDCTLDNYPCNPFNNVGCQPGQKCSFVEPTTILCLAFAADVGDFGANECFYDAAPHDEACAAGLACIPFQITNTCDGGGCCEEYCDLADPAFECSTPGNTCQPAYGVPPFEPGLEWLGFCGS